MSFERYDSPVSVVRVGVVADTHCPEFVDRLPARIPELTNAMDVLVHPSRREGLARALPQASLAGESMVSIAGGTYSGQSAVAFGLSTATRNGRWVVKASGSTNTRGTVAVGAGAGYRW